MTDRAQDRIRLAVRPISLNAAREWIASVHRHLKRPITGWLFGVEILRGEKRIGVACAGRPASRMLQDGVTCEITRVAVLEGEKNACSFAYGSLRRAAAALGYQRVITYTLDGEEPGTSLRAAGFVDEGQAGGGEANRPSRKRAPVENAAIKRRWSWRSTAALKALEQQEEG